VSARVPVSRRAGVLGWSLGIAAVTSLGAFAGSMGACGGGVPASAGLTTEPMQVIKGQFFPGPLPGPGIVSASAAADDASGDDAGDDAAPARTGPPLVVQVPAVGSTPLPIYNGEGNVDFGNGYVTPDGASIASRFTDMGTGYWIVPVGAVDSNMQFDRTFSFHANFSPSVPGGSHTLEFAAINAAGQAGPAATVEVCFAPSVPDYTTSPSKSHTCRPDEPLPPLVISMKWDAPFDVDLTVVFPDGNVLNPKQKNAEVIADEDAGEDGGAAPFFDRDSLRGCYDDGYRQEDLIFPTTPASGPYLIYANPFQACGQAATTFTATVYRAEGVCPTCGQVVQFEQAGQVLGNVSLGNGTTGGASPGLYVGTYTYP
jgi:hypothetical protein